MQVIPAIDLFQGKVVRLTRGDYSTLTNYCEVSEVLEKLKGLGLRFLHVVDLEGAHKGRIINWNAIDRILGEERLEVQVGGGIRTPEDVERLLGSGASRVIVGTLAVREPDLVLEWAERFGHGKFCAAVDLREGSLVSSAWGEQNEVRLSEAVTRLGSRGITRFLCTDVNRDGMLAGPNVELYSRLCAQFPHYEWIASGGIRSREDLDALRNAGVAGAVVGKALYEGVLRWEDLC